jgi:hypothetical protein
MFIEMSALIDSGEASPEALGAIGARYGLQVDPAGTGRIAAEHGLATALPE